uniref:Uncharacterized protein n=1 Tax=Trichuris muris TaxID=70415 RepID=A0A5S6QN37_TRIMR
MNSEQRLSSECTEFAHLGKRKNLTDQQTDEESEIFSKVRRSADDSSLLTSDATGRSTVDDDSVCYANLLQEKVNTLVETVRSQAEQHYRLWTSSAKERLNMEQHLLAADSEIHQQQEENADRLVKFSELHEENSKYLHKLSTQLSDMKVLNMQLEHEKSLAEKKLQVTSLANESLRKKVEDLLQYLESNKAPIPGETERQDNAKIFESMNLRYTDFKRMEEENKRLHEVVKHYKNCADQTVKLHLEMESMKLQAEAKEQILKDLAEENTEMKLLICNGSHGSTSTSALDELLHTVVSLRKQLGEQFTTQKENYDVYKLIAPVLKDAECQTEKLLHCDVASCTSQPHALGVVEKQIPEVAGKTKNAGIVPLSPGFIAIHFKDNPVAKAQLAYSKRELPTSDTTREKLERRLSMLEKFYELHSSCNLAPDGDQIDMETV